MKRIRLALALAAATMLPAFATPAQAHHYCGLEDVSHTVNTICNGYHEPKFLVQYIACVATGRCPIS